MSDDVIERMADAHHTAAIKAPSDIDWRRSAAKAAARVLLEDMFRKRNWLSPHMIGGWSDEILKDYARSIGILLDNDDGCGLLKGAPSPAQEAPQAGETGQADHEGA